MKIGLISDTHTHHRKLIIPDDLDMIIFAGDCSFPRDPYTNEPQVREFMSWFNNLEIKHKVWIAGNHDTSIGHKLINPRDFCNDCHYLENESIEIEGIKIWGTPYTPSFGVGWSFNADSKYSKLLYESVPEDTDIIIAHGPPKWCLDQVIEYYDNNQQPILGRHVGCKYLLNTIVRIEPKLVVCGHIHESRGEMEYGNTTIVNASCITDDYKSVHEIKIYNYEV